MKTIRWIRSEIAWKRRNPKACTWRMLIWSMLWWPDEDTPRWWMRIVSVIRRVWYVGRTQKCECPGCEHVFPAWWAGNLCVCCGRNEECCHEEVE